MPSLRRTSPLLLLASTGLVIPLLGALSPAPAPRTDGGIPMAGRLQQIETFATREDGVDRPATLVWSGRLEALVIGDGARPAVQRVFGAEDGVVRPARGRVAAPTDAPESVDALPGHDLRGAARHPETSRLYTYDATDRRLLELEGSTVLAAYDASDLDVVDVQGLALAPSVDPTDHPSELSVYVLDRGRGHRLGQVVEATFATDLALAAAVTPVSVRTVATSSWSPPSPDPSGVTYLPGPDRLVVTDGEVDEMSIFRDANIFTATRAGALTGTGVSQPWSDEPVGVGYNPSNGHLFVSDDDSKDVSEFAPGGDGRFGTSDDVAITSWDAQSRGGVSDPEGVDYDPATNTLYYAGGEAGNFHRQRAGGDGRFGTSDDAWTTWDGGVFGMQDPEGLGFDTVRGTVLVLDDSSETIYEMDRNGALVNTIDVSSANMTAAAGVTVAPASNSSGMRTYYVVARGQDNDSNPNENDGRLYEITASMPPIGGGTSNQAPSVDAGPDSSVTLPASATLNGTVSDDGLPASPGRVTTTWSKVSGPGTVTFADPAAADTTASFDTAGTYVLQLTAYDGQLTAADQVTVSVAPVGGTNVAEARVAVGADDAEQRVSTGSVALTSSDLELTTDGSAQQVVGLRFRGLQVPRGATIVSASVQFWTDEASTGAASLTIRAEASDNAPAYTTTGGNVTGRPTTAQSVAWSPPDWTTVGQAAAGQRTPDLSTLVEGVVGRAGWSPGNALALQVSGTGRRTARAFEAGAGTAPLLRVEYTGGGSTPVNQAPTVDAGTNATVSLPTSASLDGTVSDDGLPSGAPTTSWSQVSGPGTVTFGDPNAVDTTASFSAAGTYQLRLTADDGDLTGSDDVTVTVQPASPANQPPTVSAGPDLTVQLPASANLDGTVTDDGLPGGTTTATWTEVSGPGSVTFGNAGAPDTTASFSAAGTYVLRLAGSDGALSASDEVTVTVQPASGGGATTVEVRVRAGADDAEQAVSGATQLSSSDLELTTDGTRQQVVGIRFSQLGIPAGSTVTSAWVQFRTDEVSTGSSSMTIRAEATDNAPAYTATANNVTNRATGSGTVTWAPPAWNTVGEAAAAQRTPDLAALLQQVLGRPGWSSGNALALQFSGTGRRTAEAFEGGAAFAPLLHLEYTAGPGGGPSNQAPVVDAGPDRTVVLPAAASLDGSVTDDGLPSSSALSRTWTKVSGPGDVSFSSPNAEDTTASFSAAGTYVLRLTADDGALDGQDDVTVVAQPAGGGGSQTLDLRVSAGADDAEQSVRSGTTVISGNDLELTTDGTTQQVIGVRLRNVAVPAAATITNAWIQFTTDNAGTAATALTIRAEDADNTPAYSATVSSVTGRPVTTQAVAWSPAGWPTTGQAGAAQRTPDLAALVQAVIDRPGWAAGNALAFQISGTGQRTAVSFEGGASVAPLLHLEFTTG